MIKLLSILFALMTLHQANAVLIDGFNTSLWSANISFSFLDSFQHLTVDIQLPAVVNVGEEFTVSVPVTNNVATSSLCLPIDIELVSDGSFTMLSDGAKPVTSLCLCKSKVITYRLKSAKINIESGWNIKIRVLTSKVSPCSSYSEKYVKGKEVLGVTKSLYVKYPDLVDGKYTIQSQYYDGKYLFVDKKVFNKTRTNIYAYNDDTQPENMVWLLESIDYNGFKLYSIENVNVQSYMCINNVNMYDKDRKYLYGSNLIRDGRCIMSPHMWMIIQTDLNSYQILNYFTGECLYQTSLKEDPFRIYALTWFGNNTYEIWSGEESKRTWTFKKV